jgi:ParB-like chromosome segregation protein Spo0J
MQNETPMTHRQEMDVEVQLSLRPVDALRPHPAYLRHHLSVPRDQLLALAAEGESVFREPIQITRDGTIVDGYARLELARLQGRPTLLCVSLNLTEEQALDWIIRRNRKGNSFNDFTRTLLALELEPSLRERARFNQKVGGQNKGSSNLPEAQKLDVRSEIAKIAGVSVGNVTKVKKLLHEGSVELQDAVRQGELSIHRAWLSLRKPETRLEQVPFHVTKRAIMKEIKSLLRAHQVPHPVCDFDVQRIGSALAALDEERRIAVRVAEIQVPGNVLILSRELLQILQSQERMQG